MRANRRKTVSQCLLDFIVGQAITYDSNFICLHVDMNHDVLVTS